MKDYELIGQGVYHLDTHYIQPGVASLYCVVHNDEVAIIETGVSHSLPYVKQFLSDLSITADQVRYIVPTHVHLDHAGGAGVMMQAFPQAQLIVHPRGARHMINPAKLIAATKAVYGEQEFNQLYGKILAIDEDRVIVGEHESSFKLGDRELLIVDTPGHAYHHFCVIDPKSTGIFSGDTFGLSYPYMIVNGKRFVLPTTTPIHFNPQALFESIDLLMSFQPQKMYLTHFNLLADPAMMVDQYKTGVDKFVDLVERVKPEHDSMIPVLMSAMSELIIDDFGLTPLMVNTQLAMDIKLNSQGLAYWYQHRDD